ncbi:hypothetical protein [Spongiactinospora rosea]|nr:hypothetical protein [Spongiactinospora rosea]
MARTEHRAGDPVTAEMVTAEMLALLTEWAQINATARGRRYGTVYALVLEMGRWYRPAAFPAGHSRRRGPAKACHRNAARLAAAVPGLCYIEGFAAPDLGDGQVLPVEHAWCADGEVVVDPTWHDPPGRAYLGIPLTLAYRDQVLRARPRERRCDAVLDAWASPGLLIEGVPAHAIDLP